MTKKELLSLVVRMMISCAIAIGCLSLIGAASTILNIVGVAGFLAMIYYWLPTEIYMKGN